MDEAGNGDLIRHAFCIDALKWNSAEENLVKVSNFFSVVVVVGILGSSSVLAGAAAPAQKPSGSAALPKEDSVSVRIVSMEKGESAMGTDFQAGCSITEYSAKDDLGQTRLIFKRQVCNPVVLAPYVFSNKVSLISKSGLVFAQDQQNAEKLWNKVREARSSCPLTLQVSARDGRILSSDFQCNKFSELRDQDQEDAPDANPAA